MSDQIKVSDQMNGHADGAQLHRGLHQRHMRSTATGRRRATGSSPRPPWMPARQLRSGSPRRAAGGL